jgi:hypothetical protein
MKFVKLEVSPTLLLFYLVALLHNKNVFSTIVKSFNNVCVFFQSDNERSYLRESNKL